MDRRVNFSVGERFKRARLDRGVSLSQVQSSLNVRQRYIQALEADDYRALPPGVYTRGLIRQYARLLDLDAGELLAQYRRAVPPDGDVVRSAAPLLEKPPLVSLKAVVTVLVVALCVGLFAYLQAQYNSFTRSVEPGSAVSLPALSTPTGRTIPGLLTPFPSPSPLPTATSVPSPTPTSGLLVEARVTERSWVQVWVDGTPVLAETLPGGSHRAFTGKQGITMRVGNAGGVEITVNGIPHGFLGAAGQVVEAAWMLE